MLFGNQQVVCAMKSRMYRTLIVSVSAIVLALAVGGTFAGSRAASHGGFTSSHLTTSHRLAAHFRHHHRRSEAAFVWPGDEGFFSGANGGAILDGAQPIPGDIQRANANDIPWDWAHRYPPAVMLSERPYVSSCAAETVTVPDGHGGKGEVNVMRCY
jgi:hypothetical protein